MKKVDFLFQGVNESGEWDVYLIKIKTNKKTHCSTPSLRQLILLKSQSLNITYKLLEVETSNKSPKLWALIPHVTVVYYRGIFLFYLAYILPSV